MVFFSSKRNCGQEEDQEEDLCRSKIGTFYFLDHFCYNSSMIYLAADHRGFKLKEELKKYLLEQGFEVEDIGAFEYRETDDYVDFAVAASEKIAKNSSLHKGIFICGSGHGMNTVAEKHKGLRAALCFNSQVAAQSREHEDTNVLVLASDWLEAPEAKDIVMVWLGKQFSGEERHVRRLKKIEEIEEKNFR